MPLLSGHTVEALQGEELERQQRDFGGYDTGLVRLTPGRWLLPADYTKFADKLYNFKFRAGDVEVRTWPKCGSTWMQEMVWTMRHNRDFDHPLARTPINARAPLMDCDMLLGSKKLAPLVDQSAFLSSFMKQNAGKDTKDGVFFQMAEELPDPRTIKTHLPLSLLPPHLLDTAKVVYVARSPKDVLVSYHHHSRLMLRHAYTGSLDQFTQYFVDDDLVYGPYWLHLKEAWEKRDHPNMHFVYFEDFKNNSMVELRKLNKFLNTNLTEEELLRVSEYTSFSVMKARAEAEDHPKDDPFLNSEVVKNDGGFFRKGEVGDGKQRLTPQQQAKVDQWTRQHMNDFGASFKYSA